MAASVVEYATDPSEESLRQLCSVLERLVEHFADLNGWVDGVYPSWDLAPTNAVEIISPEEICVRGAALWYDGRSGPGWIEPLFCRIRVDSNTGRVERCELKLGDRERGLGRWQYGKHIRRLDWLEPKDWVVQFSG